VPISRLSRLTPLREHLLSSGVSIRQLARSTGIQQHRLGRIARAQLDPTASEQSAIAEHLGLSVSELFDPLAHLPAEQAKARRLSAFLQTPEGELVLGRLLSAMGE
jgi:transcriptional regulator with XRE-family HTH domain